MPIKYYKLFDLLQRRGMSKSDLLIGASISWPTMSKLYKGESLNTTIIERICEALNCQPGDIMEYMPPSAPASLPSNPCDAAE
jgi:DNA-binding Xre family transcriptional regulator